MTCSASSSRPVRCANSSPYGSMFMASPAPMPRIGARLVMWDTVSMVWAMTTGCRRIGSVTPTPSCRASGAGGEVAQQGLVVEELVRG